MRETKEIIEKARKIHNLLNGVDGYSNVTVEKDNINVYVYNAYLYKEITEPFEKIKNVKVYCGMKKRPSKYSRGNGK